MTTTMVLAQEVEWQFILLEMYNLLSSIVFITYKLKESELKK
jgi:hypothetical protein